MRIELDQRERELLAHLLDVAVRELGTEIRHTDRYDFKDDLKKQRDDLRHLQERLGASLATTTE